MYVGLQPEVGGGVGTETEGRKDGLLSLLPLTCGPSFSNLGMPSMQSAHHIRRRRCWDREDRNCGLKAVFRTMLTLLKY